MLKSCLDLNFLRLRSLRRGVAVYRDYFSSVTNSSKSKQTQLVGDG
jgi:hypothetical protein